MSADTAPTIALYELHSGKAPARRAGPKMRHLTMSQGPSVRLILCLFGATEKVVMPA